MLAAEERGGGIKRAQFNLYDRHVNVRHLIQVRAKAEETEAVAVKNNSLAREAGSTELLVTTLGSLLGIKDHKDVRTGPVAC